MNNLGPINSNDNVYTIKELILHASLSTARSYLAATTVKVDGIEYALFAGGEPWGATAGVDVIDIYNPVTGEFLPV